MALSLRSILVMFLPTQSRFVNCQAPAAAVYLSQFDLILCDDDEVDECAIDAITMKRKSKRERDGWRKSLFNNSETAKIHQTNFLR